jgi:hypothetical protein
MKVHIANQISNPNWQFPPLFIHRKWSKSLVQFNFKLTDNNKHHTSANPPLSEVSQQLI